MGSADSDGHAPVTIVGRLGSTPQERGSSQGMNCPDVFILSDGSIAYIGKDRAEELRAQLPDGADIGSDGRLVVFPWDAVRDALRDMPAA
jgi:hypothetical protein